MLRLGHIDYSNCVPVHALLLERATPGVTLVRDVPSALNRALAEGRIDVAPCSSIEYARHPGRYRILPDFAIGSAGPVQSILLETTRPVRELDGAVIAVPTASATSVILLRALLERRFGVRAELRWYDQAAAEDPAAGDVAAALRIGDVALTRRPRPGSEVLDLGAEWTAWTGLPFAFAVWQVRRDVDPDTARRLLWLLHESRAWFRGNDVALAARYAPGFGLSAPRLLDYWTSLRYDFDGAMQRGLMRFYALAAELGEAPAVSHLDVLAG